MQLRWICRRKRIYGKSIKIPRLIQSTFHYIPIIPTLQSLFSHTDFRIQYFQYQNYIRKIDSIYIEAIFQSLHGIKSTFIEPCALDGTKGWLWIPWSTKYSIKNFTNINQTITFKHQRQLCISSYSFKNIIEHSVLSSLSVSFFEKHEIILNAAVEDSFQGINETKWLRFNSFEFRQNFLIVYHSSFIQIKTILCNENRWLFLCEVFTVLLFDSFLNSHKIQRNEYTDHKLIDLNALDIMKLYEICFIATHWILVKKYTFQCVVKNYKIVFFIF